MFWEMFTTTLAVSMGDSLLIETVSREYFLLDDIDNQHPNQYSDEHKDVIPECEELK